MFLMIGNRTVNTDHITDIDWDATVGVPVGDYQYKNTRGVLVYLTSSAVGECRVLDFTGEDAALLATYFHQSTSTIDLNLIRPTAPFKGRYLLPPVDMTGEKSTPRDDRDESPF